MKNKFLVLWRDMMKDSDEPLPMRSFNTKVAAEAYVMGCADVICVTSKNKLEPEKVMRDFIVTEAQ